MTTESQSRLRQGLYLGLSASGVLFTWWNNLTWMAATTVEAEAAVLQFWRDAFATAIGRSLAFDIIIIGTAGLILVIAETRRVGMSRWWPILYFFLSNFVAAAFAFPLFLFFRERKLRADAT